MEFDPVNRDVAAPRYELESGSEDEFETGPDVVAKQAAEPFTIVASDGSSTQLEHGSRLVVLVSKAGAALLSSLQSAVPPQQFALRTNDEQHGAIAVVDSASGSKITAAFVAPPPQVRSSRFHEIVRTLIEAAQPSSIAVVDSYSPQEQFYRDPYSDHADGQSGNDSAIRYLATSSYVSQHKIDASAMTPLRSPESASGLGAAFLSEVSSKRSLTCAHRLIPLLTDAHLLPSLHLLSAQQAVVRNVPAILTLLEDVSFQSHIQLYGSLGAARLSPATSDALDALTGLGGKNGASLGVVAAKTGTILDFAASRRTKPASNLAVLGDGNMYI